MKRNHKSLLFLLFFIFAVFLPDTIFAFNAGDVAVVDYYLVLCLHPKMSLYDYNRAGFYKVGFGLSEEEFKAAANKLIDNPPETLNVEKNKIEKLLESVKQKKVNDLDYDTYNKLCEEENFLRKELDNIVWKYKNNDITDKEETKRIFDDIVKDINSAIEEVEKENKYNIVFNTSVAYPYPAIPRNSESMLQGYSIPGLNMIFFYGLYNKKEKDEENEIPYENIGNLYWNELTNASDTRNKYDLFPYPMVLSGGKSITSDVINKIYQKYSIDLSTQELVNSVIIKVESLKYGKPVVSDRAAIIQENK